MTRVGVWNTGGVIRVEVWSSSLHPSVDFCVRPTFPTVSVNKRPTNVTLYFVPVDNSHSSLLLLYERVVVVSRVSNILTVHKQVVVVRHLPHLQRTLKVRRNSEGSSDHSPYGFPRSTPNGRQVDDPLPCGTHVSTRLSHNTKDSQTTQERRLIRSR